MKVFGGDFLTQGELKQLDLRSCGENVLIHEHANLVGLENISIGDNVRIDAYARLVAGSEGYITLGNYIHIPSFCYLAGSAGIVMKDFSGLSQGVRIYSVSDDYSGEKLITKPAIPKEFTGGTKGTVTLERHVIIGSGSTVFPNVTIEEGTSVGAMSLVRASTDSWSIYCGVPAKKIKNRSKDLLALEKEILYKNVK